MFAVKSFHFDPVIVPQEGTLCLRGVVPASGEFGSGNVGSGTFPPIAASFNIRIVHVQLERWLNVFPGDQTGPDGVRCTEDDPGRDARTTYQTDFTLALRVGCDGDLNGDRRVTVDELVAAVGNALNGCPHSPIS
jgi:hypothetical protein